MKYQHAPDDAPLYRVPKALGGRVFPALRVYANSGGTVVAVLDVEGDLITFDQGKLTAIARPEGLPEWVLAIVLKAIAYEAQHGQRDEWACFENEVAAIPADAREYLDALREAGGAS